MRSRARRADVLLFLAAIAALTMLVIYPAAMVLVKSVMSPGGLTLSWYIRLLTYAPVIRSFWNTIVVVGGGSILSMILGVALAWLVRRADIPCRRLLESLPLIPMLFPPLLGTIGWAFLLAPKTGLLNAVLDPIVGRFDVFSIGGVIWVVTLYTIPWSYAIVAAGYDGYDNQLYEASRVSGRSLLGTILRIELPLLRPHILSALVITVLLTLSNYPVPLLLAGAQGKDVWVTVIYRITENFGEPKELAAALAGVLMILSLVATWFQRRLLKQGQFVTVSGKGGRFAPVRIGGWRWFWLSVILLYLVLSIVLPMAALVYVSVLKYWTPRFSPELLTFDSYSTLFLRSPDLWQSLVNSTFFSVLGAAGTSLLAVTVSYILLRTKLRGRGILDYFGMVSSGIPSVIFGLGVLFAYIGPPFPLYGTFWILLVAYVGHHFYISLRAVHSSLQQIPSELEEAGRVFGSGIVRTLRTITFPLVRGGVSAGWALSFILMFREFPMSMMLSSPSTRVAGVSVFDLWEQGKFNDLAAFSVLIFVVSLVIVVLVRKLIGRIEPA